MDRYRELYFQLFNKITDIIEELQSIQAEASSLSPKSGRTAAQPHSYKEDCTQKPRFPCQAENPGPVYTFSEGQERNSRQRPEKPL